MTACFRAKSTYDIHICNCDLHCTAKLRVFPLTSVFLDSEILSASHENFGTFFLSKRSSAAQKLLRKVFVKYQKNGFSGMDISFLGLAGRIKELL